MAERYKHLFLDDRFGKNITFRSVNYGPQKRLPQRDRKAHGEKLLKQLDKIWKEVREKKAVALVAKEGLYLEIESLPEYLLELKRLEDRRAKFKLLNVRKEEDKELALIFIPTGKEQIFLRKIDQYIKETLKSGAPRNEELVSTIENIRLAVVESFWRDKKELLPNEEKVWCEVWLWVEEETKKVTIEKFKELLSNLEIEFKDEVLYFPETVVLLTKCNRKDLEELIEASPHIAEFRRAKETPRFFIAELTRAEQAEWIEDLLNRLEVSEDDTIAVTVLDTGVNNGHPLLAPVLKDKDCHTYHPSWEKHDHEGHGTLTCGIAAYGDLQDALESGLPIKIHHRLESVKILPPEGKNDPRLYGAITIQAVLRAEIQAPHRKRIICMPVTSDEKNISGEGSKGEPSSWSGAIDQIASGYINQDTPKSEQEAPKLFIISAGNVEGEEYWKIYPDGNIAYSIEDPGQAWNAITVGAFTEKYLITEENLRGYTPLAPPGGLSPFNSSSLTWDHKRWPIKPEIVLEGGNLAKGPDGLFTTCDDLSLLSTHHDYERTENFWPHLGTSAATALAAWMVAQIQATYPEIWPETVRALLIHSAEWTEEMKQQFLKGTAKKYYAILLRTCGYGVPNLERAIYSFKNALTLVIQDELQPFERSDSGALRSKEMRIYELPWPREVLESLGETPVTLSVTLSYFIEPSPGQKGWRHRYRYPSHGLRFDINTPTEDRDTFVKRLNKAAREEEENRSFDSGSDRWIIGKNNRSLGSIHSDIWEGTAVELAACNLIGVYPVSGWWKERPWLKRYNKKVRYALIVSLRTPSEEVDLYTPVAVKIGVPIEVEV